MHPDSPGRRRRRRRAPHPPHDPPNGRVRAAHPPLLRHRLWRLQIVPRRRQRRGRGRPLLPQLVDRLGETGVSTSPTCS